MNLTDSIQNKAKELGFDLVGFSHADTLDEEKQKLMKWISNGYAGKMEYLTRDPEARTNPESFLKGSQTIISLAVNYHQSNQSSEKLGTGKVSKYAWGKDYHLVLKNKLTELELYIQSLPVNKTIQTRSCVDAGIPMEKALAVNAGLGFIGKNTNLITREYGSWVFLAEIYTTLKLDCIKNTLPISCGHCKLCLDACPTSAFPEPYVLDANRCISYLTIELKDSIPIGLREKMGHWAFGCDICQDICPFNQKWSKPLKCSDFMADKGVGSSMQIEDYSTYPDNQSFKKAYKTSPIVRAKRDGIIRNLLIVIANQKDMRYLEIVKEIMENNENPVVHETAVWAINKLINNNKK